MSIYKNKILQKDYYNPVKILILCLSLSLIGLMLLFFIGVLIFPFINVVYITLELCIFQFTESVAITIYLGLITHTATDSHNLFYPVQSVSYEDIKSKHENIEKNKSTDTRTKEKEETQIKSEESQIKKEENQVSFNNNEHCVIKTQENKNQENTVPLVNRASGEVYI